MSRPADRGWKHSERPLLDVCWNNLLQTPLACCTLTVGRPPSMKPSQIWFWVAIACSSLAIVLALCSVFLLLSLAATYRQLENASYVDILASREDAWLGIRRSLASSLPFLNFAAALFAGMAAIGSRQKVAYLLAGLALAATVPHCFKMRRNFSSLWGLKMKSLRASVTPFT